MNKITLVVIFIGILSGIALAQITAIDANNVAVTQQTIRTESVNQLCNHVTFLNQQLQNAELMCQQAQVLTAAMANQQINAIP